MDYRGPAFPGGRRGGIGRLGSGTRLPGTVPTNCAVDAPRARNCCAESEVAEFQPGECRPAAAASSRLQLDQDSRDQLGLPSGGCARRCWSVVNGASLPSYPECRARPRRHRRRERRAPRISSLSASTTTFIKPCDSPFSTARCTRVMGRAPTRILRPLARASRVRSIPTRPSGGSMNRA